MQSMKRSSLRLLRLVNNLIDISKIDTGFYVPDFKNYDIVEIIEKIALSVKDYARQKNIEIEFKSKINQAAIRCDADMIERIMLNLISNAIKFSHSHCLIQITIGRLNEFIHISVKDNGVGIEDNMKETIFERYKQVQTTLSRASEGSGIGLSLTKALVEMHNGQISVESKFEAGSEFIVKIPDILCSEEPTKNYETVSDHGIVLKMNVEFSDIYI